MKLELDRTGPVTSTSRPWIGDFVLLSMTLEAADAILSEDIRCERISYVAQQTEPTRPRG